MSNVLVGNSHSVSVSKWIVDLQHADLYKLQYVVNDIMLFILYFPQFEQLLLFLLNTLVLILRFHELIMLWH